MLKVTDSIQIPKSELDFSFARSSGPGGQNVNKVNSKAVLHWDVRNNQSLPLGVKTRLMVRFATRLNSEGFLVLSSDRFRDQGRNVEDCLEKLCEMLLEVEKPPKLRKATKPTRSAKKRRRESKDRRSDTKKQRGRVRD